MIYNVNPFSNNSTKEIEYSLTKINDQKKLPVIVCIGSDLVLGDSLGPLVGTILTNKKIKAYVYGTLNFPITAKEISITKKYIEKTHKNTEVISIDAAVGEKDEIGQIKIIPKGIKPGLGVNKDLEEIGDKSIIGIVSEKTKDNRKLFESTRLNLIYKMANTIANGVENYINALTK